MEALRFARRLAAAVLGLARLAVERYAHFSTVVIAGSGCLNRWYFVYFIILTCDIRLFLLFCVRHVIHARPDQNYEHLQGYIA